MRGVQCCRQYSMYRFKKASSCGQYRRWRAAQRRVRAGRGHQMGGMLQMLLHAGPAGQRASQPPHFSSCISICPQGALPPLLPIPPTHPPTPMHCTPNNTHTNCPPGLPPTHPLLVLVRLRLRPRGGVHVEHVARDLHVALSAAFILDNEDQVEAGQDGGLQVDVLLQQSMGGEESKNREWSGRERERMVDCRSMFSCSRR